MYEEKFIVFFVMMVIMIYHGDHDIDLRTSVGHGILTNVLSTNLKISHFN